MNKLMQKIHSLYLWWVYRKDWKFIRTEYIGIRTISPDGGSGQRYKKFKKTYKHKIYGYIEHCIRYK